MNNHNFEEKTTSKGFTPKMWPFLLWFRLKTSLKTV